MTDLIEISKPIAYDPQDGTYRTAETLIGLRVRHGRTTRQTRTYSRTGVEHKAPSGTMAALTEAAAEHPNRTVDVGPGTGFSVKTALAAEKRGLGKVLHEGARKYQVTGFRLAAPR